MGNANATDQNNKCDIKYKCTVRYCIAGETYSQQMFQLLRRIIPMADALETGAINRLYFLAPISVNVFLNEYMDMDMDMDIWTCIMQIWDQLRLVSDSGAH